MHVGFASNGKDTFIVNCCFVVHGVAINAYRSLVI